MLCRLFFVSVSTYQVRTCCSTLPVSHTGWEGHTVAGQQSVSAESTQSRTSLHTARQCGRRATTASVSLFIHLQQQGAWRKVPRPPPKIQTANREILLETHPAFHAIVEFFLFLLLFTSVSPLSFVQTRTGSVRVCSFPQTRISLSVTIRKWK